MKENDAGFSFSLESIEFILRHPWLFFCPFVIISSILVSSAAHTTLFYKSSAVLSFESAGEQIIETKQTMEKKEELIGKILLGENIDKIIGEAWPNLNEKTEPLIYAKRRETLRAPKSGIEIKPEKDPRLLSISFQNTHPDICYKVVQATINTIIRENKKEVGARIETGLSFLTTQVEFYKDKLKALEEEMLNIKDELRKKLPELTPSERDLVKSLFGEAVARDIFQATTPALQKSINYDQILTELNLELLDAQKKKERLQKQIETGAYSLRPATDKSFENDFIIQEYNKAIAAKEIEISRAISAGYMPEHPSIKILQKEAETMKAAKESRLQELKGRAPQAPDAAKKQAEEAAKAELETIQFQIEDLKEKIHLMEGYQRNVEGQLRSQEIENSFVSDKAAKLLELQNEKAISTKYYTDLRKQLEEIQLKSRLEKEKAGFNITVVEAPTIPLKPIPFQKLPKMLLGLVMALGAGGGLAYTVDSLNNPIRSSSELRELLKIPVLATIDKINTLQEINLRRMRRKTILISLAAIAILSNIVIAVLTKTR